MGPPEKPITNPLRFDEKEDYYLCKKCSTHITLHSQLLQKYDFPESLQKHYLLIKNLLRNAVLDVHNGLKNTKATVISVYCGHCFTDLGFKLHALQEPKDEIQPGTYIVYPNKLILWKGKKILDAMTEEDVVQNLLHGVAKKLADVPLEQKKEILAITDQLKLLFGLTDEQVDGMTMEPVEMNEPEAATEGTVEKNEPESVTEDPIDQN